MNLEVMELAELKDYAKKIGLPAGNIGKEKLIEKIKEKESLNALENDEDLAEGVFSEDPIIEESPKSETALIDSIADAIDEMDESSEDSSLSETVDLALNESIPVKSITFGGLTYKSRSTNAIYRWNQIGAVEYMTVAELNEMNNYKRAFLNKPLVILMDERAIKKFRLQKVYENVAKISNLKQLFKSDATTISRAVQNAIDVNMRDILISKTRQMIKNKSLTDINVIKLLEDKLKHDFTNAI